MHLAEADAAAMDRGPAHDGLSFLWLELTNRCNLRCVHCYTESSPWTGDRDVLTRADHERVMHEAFALGCRRIQLIGGEPQVSKDFVPLMTLATELGFEYVEVFTNLTRLPEATLRLAAETGVRFATSVYSDDPAEHDAITGVRSSHTRTMRNLGRLVDEGVETRAGVIRIDQAQETIRRTKAHLVELGVGHVRDSAVRGFGRGEEVTGEHAGMEGLCGHCWAGKLCVAPDGMAYPCVMARQWPVGNVLESSLAEIVAGRALARTRADIFREAWLPRLSTEYPPDEEDDGYEGGEPTPAEGCFPAEDEEVRPAEGDCSPERPACPQSCVPDTIPPTCPQSCEPFIAVCDPTEPE